jgi:hypothetical protein
VLGVGLDAFAHDRAADLPAELHETRDQGMDRRIALEGVDPLQVELDGAGAKRLDVAEAGVSRSGDVDRDLDAGAESVDRREQLGLVADRLVLRQLDHERPW